MIFDQKFLNLLEAVTFIALSSDPVSNAGISKLMDVPERALEPELQALTRAGVLKSIRGPKGGYILARERRNITLLDILSSAESWRLKPENFLSGIIKQVEQEIAKVTLHEVCLSARDYGLDKAVTAKADFAI